MFQHRICNTDYDEQLNQRLNTRYFPTQELQPNFSPIPVPTQYTHFMKEDPNVKADVPLHNYREFETSHVFYPGTTKGPVHRALAQVDLESLLENRFMALQKNDQAYYIPSKNSDLYKPNSKIKDKPNPIDLYQLQEPIVKNMDKCNLAPNVFHNPTRYNVKNLK